MYISSKARMHSTTRIGESRRDINPETIAKAEGRPGRNSLVT